MSDMLERFNLDNWKKKDINWATYMGGIWDEKKLGRLTVHLPSELEKIKKLMEQREMRKGSEEYEKIHKKIKWGLAMFYSGTMVNLRFGINQLHHINEFKKFLEKEKTIEKENQVFLQNTINELEGNLNYAAERLLILRNMITKIGNEVKSRKI